MLGSRGQRGYPRANRWPRLLPDAALRTWMQKSQGFVQRMRAWKCTFNLQKHAPAKAGEAIAVFSGDQT
jgi:hypothetical protein